MAKRTRCRLALVALGEPLRRYAARIEPDDQNAAFMLVHQALAGALAKGCEAYAGPAMETALRADIDAGHRAAAGLDQRL
jgi:hypothetical protein